MKDGDYHNGLKGPAAFKVSISTSCGEPIEVDGRGKRCR